MQRRLFLKNSAISAVGIAASPLVFQSCSSAEVLTQISKPNPMVDIGKNLFSQGAEFYDLAIAELRISGNGPMVGAEAEDYNLPGVVTQIYTQMEVMAEIPIIFAESSEMFMDSAFEMFEHTSELLPVPPVGYPDLAENFGLLKTMKASSILLSAAEVDPFNAKRAEAAEGLLVASQEIYDALLGGISAEASSELSAGTEDLLGYSEKYVGVSEVFSGTEAFENGVDEAELAGFEFAEHEFGKSAAHLLGAAETIALSAEYYAEGVGNLNKAAEILNFAEQTTGKDLVSAAQVLVAESAEFVEMAEGEPAKLGAAEMLVGAENMLAEAETDIQEIYGGGMTFEIGAERYIAGTLSHQSTAAYVQGAGSFLEGAENMAKELQASGEADADTVSGFEIGSEILTEAAEEFAVAAEALEYIEVQQNLPAAVQGVENLVPASMEILEGAEPLPQLAEWLEAEAEAEPGALAGAEKLVGGAEIALQGASEAAAEPSVLETAAETIETGAAELMGGAMEFIQGIEIKN